LPFANNPAKPALHQIRLTFKAFKSIVWKVRKGTVVFMRQRRRKENPSGSTQKKSNYLKPNKDIHKWKIKKSPFIAGGLYKKKKHLKKKL